MNTKDKLKAVKFFGALLVFLGLMLAAYFYFTASLVTAADKFFQSLKGGTDQDKIVYLSDDFKAHIEPLFFSTAINEMGLKDYRSAQWSSRSIKSNRGSLVGVIKTDEQSLPATISFVKENDEWKVYSLQIRSEASQAKEESRELPGEKQQLLLAKQSQSIFFTAVKQKSMQYLYDNSAIIWQKNTTVDTLNDAFKTFYEEEVDFLYETQNIAPAFDHKAKLDKEGFMLIAGFYTLDEKKVNFKQRYIYEGFGWELVGLDVEFK